MIESDNLTEAISSSSQLGTFFFWEKLAPPLQTVFYLSQFFLRTSRKLSQYTPLEASEQSALKLMTCYRGELGLLKGAAKFVCIVKSFVRGRDQTDPRTCESVILCH